MFKLYVWVLKFSYLKMKCGQKSNKKCHTLFKRSLLSELWFCVYMLVNKSDKEHFTIVWRNFLINFPTLSNFSENYEWERIDKWKKQIITHGYAFEKWGGGISFVSWVRVNYYYFLSFTFFPLFYVKSCVRRFLSKLRCSYREYFWNL